MVHNPYLTVSTSRSVLRESSRERWLAHATWENSDVQGLMPPSVQQSLGGRTATCTEVVRPRVHLPRVAVYTPIPLLPAPRFPETVSGLGDLSSSERNAYNRPGPFAAIRLGDLAASLDEAADAVCFKPVCVDIICLLYMNKSTRVLMQTSILSVSCQCLLFLKCTLFPLF